VNSVIVSLSIFTEVRCFFYFTESVICGIYKVLFWLDIDK